jgi:hypothetical protein
MSDQPTHEEIRVLAYELYRQCGCEHGHDLRHWLEAEQALRVKAGRSEIQHKRTATAGSSNW